MVTVAVRLGWDGERVAEARIALGAAGPHPIRARQAEHAPVGTGLERGRHRRGRRRGRPTNANRSRTRIATDWYRRRMVGVFVGRALEQVARSTWPRAPGEGVASMASTIVAFELGGREVEVMVAPLTTLQSVLRNQLGYTATKEGCRQGGCGSCTVLVDGEPMMSCLLPVEDVAGRRVTTLEGLTPAEGLHPIQQAFLDSNAFQCGYCTPGMVMVAKALLDHNPAPSRDEIAEALAGNVCRCTGYGPIVRAIEGGRGMNAATESRHDELRPQRRRPVRRAQRRRSAT